MQNLLPNNQRAQWASYSIGIYGAIMLAFALSQIWQARIISSNQLDTETAAYSDMVVGIAAMFFLVGLITCTITFIRWFRKAYANLHRIGAPILGYDEVWAATAWLVPFMNLFRPYTIAKEIWQETQAQIPGKIEQDGMESAEHVGWWWAAWVVYNILSQITSKIGDESTIEGLKTSLNASAFGTLIGIPAAILCWMYIKKVSAWETELYESQYQTDPVDHFLGNEI